VNHKRTEKNTKTKLYTKLLKKCKTATEKKRKGIAPELWLQDEKNNNGIRIAIKLYLTDYLFTHNPSHRNLY
jgi:hypothetical protein